MVATTPTLPLKPPSLVDQWRRLNEIGGQSALLTLIQIKATFPAITNIFFCLLMMSLSSPITFRFMYEMVKLRHTLTPLNPLHM